MPPRLRIERAEFDAATLEHGTAFGRIVLEREQLALRRPARRIVEVERCPGVVLRMIGQPPARGEQQAGDDQQPDRAPIAAEVPDAAGDAPAVAAQWKSRDLGMIRTLRGCLWR